MNGERKDAADREPVSRGGENERRPEPSRRETEDVRGREPVMRSADDEAWRRDRRGAEYPAEAPGLEPGPQAILGAEAANLRRDWEAVQAGFVDEPRQAVERADALVARAAQHLADAFASERGRLEQQWSRGDEVSTEDLRVALRRYRAFFDRLLSI
jgi:hypothetical protein